MRWRGKGEDTREYIVSQSLHHRLFPLEQNPLLSAPADSSLAFPLPPLQELSQHWRRPATAAGGSNDGKGGVQCPRTPRFYLFVFICLFLDK